MKLNAHYQGADGTVLTTEDGKVVWADRWAHDAPEDCTVGRDIGRLLEALGVELVEVPHRPEDWDD